MVGLHAARRLVRACPVVIDDPCDEWPVVELRGELYVVQSWGDRLFVVFNRVTDSLHAWGDALRLSGDVMKIAVSNIEPLERAERLELLLDNRRARGYRQFEYGGKRWKGRR